MNKIKLKYCFYLTLLVFATACSTKKNTALSRGYHNLTSRYNILFNGWESFDKGMLKLQDSKEDDFTELIPVFIYQDKDEVSAIGAEMDRSIKKATKVISLHSITAKPELKDSRELTPKQREFYNKNEYNKWVDDSYLLLGKGHFYKHEFDKASETFQYIVTNYPDGIPQFEARLWLARVALEKGRQKEAESILAELEESEDLPEKLTPDISSTKAHLEIIKENYTGAIDNLTNAVQEVRSKYYKQRYNYIIAQLYQLEGNAAEATNYYLKVIKLNPPYEMTFNAKINMALSYEVGAVSRKEIEKQLDKMLRDDKNIDYQDQIYYAWGNLYFQEGDIEKAIEYYILSATVSQGNVNQQARTYLKIADIYYDQPDYVSAQAFYDSAVGVIDMNYPNYNIIYAKSISLTNLVEDIQTVELEDSVQILAKWPKEKLNDYIDDLIAEQRRLDEERKIREEEERLSQTFDTQQQYELKTSSSSWYFYNTTAVNLGRQEFKRKWGRRALEDNWRRLNKTVLNEGSSFASEIEDSDTLSAMARAEKPTDKYSRQYYLVDIPFTDSALEVSHLRIQESLFSMGDIYYEELKDYDKSISSFTELLKRYPAYERKIQVYYKLYTIGKETEDIDMVSTYRQKIINEFPNSNYAKVLNDPDYFKKIEQKERREEELYVEVYESFTSGNLIHTVYLINKAIKETPNSQYSSQYDYMLTLAEGTMKDTVTFIGDLQKLISRYPDSEISERSQLLINYLQTENPEAAREQAIKEAATLFSTSSEEEHYVVVAIPKNENVNQLTFNIINFNIDNYSEGNLTVKKEDVGSYKLLNINIFEGGDKASEYYKQIKNHPDLFKDVNMAGSKIFYISVSNMQLLIRDQKLNEYVTFFEENIR